MANAPQFKVYTADGEYIAACKNPEDAAMILAGYSTEGMTIRRGHDKRSIKWTEGPDGEAGNSFDYVAQIVWERCQ